MTMNNSRPKMHLVAAGKLFPGAWRLFDQCRQDRGVDLPDWPDYVYCPMAASYAIVSGGGSNRISTSLIADVGRLAAVAAWRVTQGVFRFDPTLYASLIDTEIKGDLPCDMLRRLPAWCVYIETPGHVWGSLSVFGFFAHLEWDSNTGREELRLLMDCEEALIPVPIHLGPWSLEEALNRSFSEAVRQGVIHGNTREASLMSSTKAQAAKETSDSLAPLLSLLLYLCAENADLGEHRPSYPKPKRTKEGWRLFPPDKPTTWEVGVRIGAALRKAYQQAEFNQPSVDSETGRARPRGHVRHAHWHTFLHGEGRSKRKLKWMPPIPVNLDDDELPTTIRTVKE